MTSGNTEDAWETRIRALTDLQAWTQDKIKYLREHEMNFGDQLKTLPLDQRIDVVMREALTPSGLLWRTLQQQAKFNEHVIAMLTDLDYRKSEPK